MTTSQTDSNIANDTDRKEEQKKAAARKRNELFLIGGLLIFSLAFFACYRFLNRGTAATVSITVDGAVYQELPLSKDADLVIPSAHGGSNHLVIKDGAASITEASCPDKVCVHQGAVRENGAAIVCLPNKVVVTIK